MGKAYFFKGRILLYLILVIGLALMDPVISFAADSVCARVKIEIQQELTLERQAFNAHMRVKNGLTHITLESVRVVVARCEPSSLTSCANDASSVSVGIGTCTS